MSPSPRTAGSARNPITSARESICTPKGQYCEEREYGWKSLKFLYGTAAGRVLLKIFFCRGIYSKLNGAFMKSPLSVYCNSPKNPNTVHRTGNISAEYVTGSPS